MNSYNSEKGSSEVSCFELCNFKVNFFALFLLENHYDIRNAVALCFLPVFHKRSNLLFFFNAIFVLTSELGAPAWAFPMAAVD